MLVSKHLLPEMQHVLQQAGVEPAPRASPHPRAATWLHTAGHNTCRKHPAHAHTHTQQATEQAPLPDTRWRNRRDFFKARKCVCVRVCALTDEDETHSLVRAKHDSDPRARAAATELVSTFY